MRGLLLDIRLGHLDGLVISTKIDAGFVAWVGSLLLCNDRLEVLVGVLVLQRDILSIFWRDEQKHGAVRVHLVSCRSFKTQLLKRARLHYLVLVSFLDREKHLFLLL